MSDKRLRELERRWEESGSAEDWKALVREQLRTGTGVVAETVSFLERLHAFCGSIEDLAFRAWALAELAWAIQPLGCDAWALDVAQEALALRPEQNESAYQRARIRVAAVRQRIEGGEAGREEFEAVLTWAEEALAGVSGGREQVEARNVTGAWWNGLADAGATYGLAERGARRLGPLGTSEWVHSVRESWDVLVQFGFEAMLTPEVRSYLAPEGTARLKRAVVNFMHPAAALCVAVQDCMDILGRRSGGLAPRDARAYLECVRADAALIDEFSVEILAASFRVLGEPSWVESIQDSLAHVDPYRAQLVEIAGLYAAGDAQGLEAEFERTWAFEETPQAPRHRLLTRLVPLVPILVPPEHQASFLEAIYARAVDPATQLDSYAVNEVLQALAMRVIDTGSATEAQRLMSMVIDTVASAWQPSARQGSWWLYSEALDVVLSGARRLGESARLRVDRVTVLVESVLPEFARGREDGVFHCGRTLLRCAGIYRGLDDAATSKRCLTMVEGLLAGLSSWDLADLLTEAVAEAGFDRSLTLAEWTLQHAEGLVSAGSWRACSELVTELARGAVAPIRDATKSELTIR